MQKIFKFVCNLFQNPLLLSFALHVFRTLLLNTLNHF